MFPVVFCLIAIIFLPAPPADAEIIERGALDTPGNAQSVALTGNLALIADGAEGGLRIIDIADPAELSLAGVWDSPGECLAVAAAGNRAFVADGWEGVRIVDIADPAEPAEVGVFAPDGIYAAAVAVAGDIAFVADLTAGVRIVNVADPEDPRQVSLYDTPDLPLGLFAVADRFLYIADRRSGVHLLDVSDPSEPRRLASADTPGEARGVYAREGTVLVADDTGGLRLFAADLELIGAWDSPGRGSGVAAWGNYAYLADGASGLRILQIADPAEPVDRGAYDSPGTALAVAAHPDGGLLFLADGEGGVRAVGLTPELTADPAAVDFGDVELGDEAAAEITIANTGHFDAPIRASVQGRGFAVEPAEAVIPAGAAPALTVTFAPQSPGIYAGALNVHYAGAEEPAVVVDLEGFAFFIPEEVGAYDTPEYALGVFVAGDYAFVADYFSGLQVIDIADPAQPRRVGGYDTPGAARGVFVAGDYAFVADGTSGLQVIDIAAPAQPRRVGGYDTPGFAYGVFVAGDYAFVADHSSGLQVIDIADPAQPRRVGGYDTPGYAFGVFVAGDYAFVADYTSGLQVIDIADPAQPRRVGGYDTPGDARGVFVAGGYAFVADGESGLRIYDVSPLLPITAVSAERIDFGAVPVGAEAAQSVTLRNEGGGLLRVMAVEVAGAGFACEVQTPLVIAPGEEREFTVTFAPQQGGEATGTLNFRTNAGNLTVELAGIGFVEQRIPLQAGWNMTSLNFVPTPEYYAEGEERGPDVVRLLEQFADEEGGHRVIMAKDETGRFYRPQFGFNNIPYWDLTQGYMVKMSAAAEGVWHGVAPIPADADVPLARGWNFIAYYPTYELSAAAPEFYVLSPIIDYVEMAKDIRGNFLRPQFRYSNMPPWRPGQGYQVKVTQDCVLNYPPQRDENVNVNMGYEDWADGGGVVRTGANMSLLIVNRDLQIAAGGEIRALSGDGQTVGVGVLPSAENTGQSIGLAVWGDDPTTPARDGLAEGEPFRLALGDPATGAATPLDVMEVLDGEGLIYRTDGFTAVAASLGGAAPVIPDACYLAEGYPNPFNSAVRFAFGLPKGGWVTVRVWDVAGRQVATLVDGRREAGVYAAVWRAENAPAGVYIVRMETGAFNSARKVTLMK